MERTIAGIMGAKKLLPVTPPPKCADKTISARIFKNATPGEAECRNLPVPKVKSRNYGSTMANIKVIRNTTLPSTSISPLPLPKRDLPGGKLILITN